MGARVLVYDGSARRGETPLRTAWSVGARVYATLGRVDAHHGAKSWDEALGWLATVSRDRPIDEVQFWGHGHWGLAKIDREELSIQSFRREHPHRRVLTDLKARLAPRALLWFRTCETLGANAGHAFAKACTEELGVRVAGHTFVIGAWQSGLHGLRPGAAPRWDPEEGLRQGTPERPVQAHASSPSAPNTIHFMNGRVPEDWF
jgi:hypothetical protein